jgi:CSLREA domain-containing protein
MYPRAVRSIPALGSALAPVLGLALGLAATAACGFSSPKGSPSDGPPADTPPVVTEVRFTSVTASEAMLRPGLYGISVTAVLRNELTTEIAGIRASLTFRDGAADRAGDFRWRDADAREGVMAAQPATIPAGGEATFHFIVDARPSSVGPGPLRLGGEASFLVDGAARSAAPLDPPTSLPYATLRVPIVVSTATDEDNGDATLSLREAIKLANSNQGLDRIVFSPTVFPPGNTTPAFLSAGLGEIPAVNGDLVIDGSDASYILAVNAFWRGSSRYGLRLQSGTLVVHDLGFQDLGEGYPTEDVSSNNCGTGLQGEGGAIRVDGGTLILDGNRFSDSNVTERNCYAASVRILGGSGHRILRNIWTSPSMDAIYIDAATREVTDNVIDGSAGPAKADDCVFVARQGNTDLWLVGNLCVDQEYSGVAVSDMKGTDTGTLHVVNNTFVRDRGSAVRHSAARRVELHNNVYYANQPAAITSDLTGTNLRISYEAELNNTAFCAGCTSAMIQTQTNLSGMSLVFENESGATPADLTPRTDSPLAGSGTDLLDRNGSVPGRFSGKGHERGAFELP